MNDVTGEASGALRNHELKGNQQVEITATAGPFHGNANRNHNINNVNNAICRSDTHKSPKELQTALHHLQEQISGIVDFSREQQGNIEQMTRSLLQQPQESHEMPPHKQPLSEICQQALQEVSNQLQRALEHIHRVQQLVQTMQAESNAAANRHSEGSHPHLQQPQERNNTANKSTLPVLTNETITYSRKRARTNPPTSALRATTNNADHVIDSTNQAGSPHSPSSPLATHYSTEAIQMDVATNINTASSLPSKKGTRDHYKRREEPPIPIVASPANRTQYTKIEAMNILMEYQHNVKDRNRLIHHWIAQKLVPVTSHITMNKYFREMKTNGRCVKSHWESAHCLLTNTNDTATAGPPPKFTNDIEDDSGNHGDSKLVTNSKAIINTDRTLSIPPPPANGKEYTRHEAVRILLPLTPKERNTLVSHWITQGMVPIKSISAMERTIIKAEKLGIGAISIHWGRWGPTTTSSKNSSQRDRTKQQQQQQQQHLPATCVDNPCTKKTTSTTVSSTTPVLPPYPPPKYGNEYTKLEAVTILQRMPSTSRNAVLWKWIQQKQIPISHPNSMVRILREAKTNTLKTLDWKQSDQTLPWVPAPRCHNGTMYTKSEMISLLRTMNPRDRNKLVRQWVYEKKIPYTSPLSANNAVVKAMRESKLHNSATVQDKDKDPPLQTNVESSATTQPAEPQDPRTLNVFHHSQLQNDQGQIDE